MTRGHLFWRGNHKSFLSLSNVDDIHETVSIGCGYIGSVLAEEIAHSLDFEKLIICDSTKEKIEETAERLGEKIFPLQMDISDCSSLLEIIDDADIVIGLSPGKLRACKSLEFMRKFWEENPSFFEEKDLVLMRTKIDGRKDSTKILHTYEVIDWFDEKRKITAMGRTTAYTAFAVIKLMIEDRIDRKGVIPPEILGMDRDY